MPSEALIALFKASQIAAKGTFEIAGHLSSVFTVDLSDGKRVAIPVSFWNPTDKKMKLRILREMFKALHVIRYSFTTEMWFTIHADKRDFDNAVLPSENPARQEGIMVLAEEQGDPQTLGGMFMITRSADGAGKLGPFESAATYMPMGSFAGLLGSGMFN